MLPIPTSLHTASLAAGEVASCLASVGDYLPVDAPAAATAALALSPATSPSGYGKVKPCPRPNNGGSGAQAGSPKVVGIYAMRAGHV